LVAKILSLHSFFFVMPCVYELEIMFNEERNINKTMSWEWVLKTMA